MDKSQLYRALPNIDDILRDPQVGKTIDQCSRVSVLDAARTELEILRQKIGAGAITEPPAFTDIVRSVTTRAHLASQRSLHRIINATGIIIHTNLGRSLLAREAIEAVVEVAGSYSTLEYDVESAARGSRHTHVESLLCELTGAEAALVVNNNAAAVMMVIACFAKDKEAIVSRGELVEIGGSFRVPDVMAQSGAHMVEIGTTNKTHLWDFENAITPNTGLIMRVHTSNYRVVGFTEAPSLPQMVELGTKHGIPVMEDQGSGVLIDLQAYGLPYEPTVQESVASGVTVVTCSGDKLLGGPQAGIIVGKAEAIARLKKHPLARALRIDKMTLAALEATLRLYRDPEKAVRSIPTLAALTMSESASKERAEALATQLFGVDKRIQTTLVKDIARAGGGSLPLADVPSWTVGVAIEGMSESELEQALRLQSEIPIVSRIKDGVVLFDPRTLVADDVEVIVNTMRLLVQ